MQPVTRKATRSRICCVDRSFRDATRDTSNIDHNNNHTTYYTNNSINNDIILTQTILIWRSASTADRPPEGLDLGPPRRVAGRLLGELPGGARLRPRRAADTAPTKVNDYS